MLSIVCVCCVSRCLQEPCDFHEALEDHGQNDNCIAELTFFKLRIERPLDIGISDKQLEIRRGVERAGGVRNAPSHLPCPAGQTRA